jgi:hypothetical protein
VFAHRVHLRWLCSAATFARGACALLRREARRKVFADRVSVLVLASLRSGAPVMLSVNHFPNLLQNLIHFMNLSFFILSLFCFLFEMQKLFLLLFDQKFWNVTGREPRRVGPTLRMWECRNESD